MRSSRFSLTQATGRFPFRACKADRRLAYGVYVPDSFEASRARVLVAVHGSERAPEAARELFVDLAEELGCVVLAPSFPMALTDDEELHNYLFLAYGGIRFDLALLAMIDEVNARFGLPVQPFWLAGFSGGGQFAHRFAYLHASRLAGVSIGAPGMVNTLDPALAWPAGVRDVQARFSLEVDRAGLRGLPVQVVVGAEDLTTDIVVSPPDPLYAEGINDTGATRVERARFLHVMLEEAGAITRLDVVPGAMHAAEHVQLAVEAFFREMPVRDKA